MPPLSLRSLGNQIVVTVICLVGLYSIVSAQKPVLTDYSAREDFQGDSLGQWASYPPAQDIGYEPSLTPTSDFDAPGGRALMRWIQPTQSGDLRFGFIKRVGIVTNSTSRINLDYRINATTETVRVEVGVAGADGHRYTSRADVVTNRWTKLSIELAKLKRSDGTSLVSGTGIDALYMIAYIAGANKDSIYRFLIDNVEVKASHAASFSIAMPTASEVEPWASQITAVSYRPDDVVRIEARAPVGLSRATVTFRNSVAGTGIRVQLYDNGTHGDVRAKDGTWTNSAAHKFARTDASGVWRAELRGETPDGRAVVTELRFLVHKTSRSGHPRLYFGGSDRAKLIARTRDEKLGKVWEHIQTAAKNSRATGQIAHGGRVFELLDTEYLLPSLLGYFDVLNRARARIAHNAFVAYLTGDLEARAAAKDAMLTVSRWSRWEPPWFTAHGQHTYYPAGLLAVDVALGYDLLYEHLSESERSQIRRALIENQIIPTYKEYFLDNRAMADTSNWISHTVGGALIASAAIAGDVTPEESDGKFDLYVNGLLMKIEAHMAASYLPDGSYGEGISYQEFDSETLAPMMIALERAFGVDYWDTTHVKDSLRYALYTLTDPREASPDMGDTHPSAGHGIAPIVYRSNDPVIRWFYSRFDRPSIQQFIFYDDSVRPRSPAAAAIPTSTIFDDKGNAVFRTGWDKDSITMLFRAGPNFNHHHADQGSFLITAFGEPLVTEAGWSDYYKDPYYATFFTQAVGHNTVLINGDPESQVIPDTPQFKALDDYPRITDAVTSEFYDGVGSDLSSVYRDRIERYARRIVFLKPHYFVVYDSLTTPRQADRFNFLLHVPDRAGVTTEGLTAIYKGTQAALGVRSFTSADAVLNVRNGRIPYHIFSLRTPAETPLRPAYLDVETRGPRKEMRLATAIVPAKTESAAEQLIGQMFPITGENLTGLRVERGTETDLVMFNTLAGSGAMRHADWSARASVLCVTNQGSELRMLAAQNAQTVTHLSRTMFSSEKPVSIAISYRAGGLHAVVNSEAGTKLLLFVGTRPSGLLLDGAPPASKGFSFDGSSRTITINVPAGQHEIRMDLK